MRATLATATRDLCKICAVTVTDDVFVLVLVILALAVAPLVFEKAFKARRLVSFASALVLAGILFAEPRRLETRIATLKAPWCCRRRKGRQVPGRQTSPSSRPPTSRPRSPRRRRGAREESRRQRAVGPWRSDRS